MFKKSSTATPVAAQPTQPHFDPSTWANQPRLLASNEAEAAAIEAGGWSIGAVLLVLVLAVLAVVAGAPIVPAFGIVAVVVVIGALYTLWRWAVTYAEALRRDTDEARRATWQREMERNEDIDGDGYIADPFHGVKVSGRDGADDEVIIIPKPSNSARHQPVMEGWGVSAEDLVAFAFEVEAGRGLQEREWVAKGVTRFVLPSGRTVSQGLLRQIQDALAEHGMAGKPDGKWELSWKAERIARYLADNLK